MTHDDETVERVLLREVLTWLRDPRLSQWNYMEGTAFYVDKHAMAEKIEAALSALPRAEAATHCFECNTELHGPYCPKCADDALEGLLAKALRRLAYWAQTSGGTAGRDDGLVAAIDVGLAALREYDTKHTPPAQAGER